MTNKSRTLCLTSILAIILSSLPCVYFLNIQEYVRLAVLGIFILSLLLVYRKDFSRALWRRAVFGLCLAFLIYACDPLTSGGIDPTKEIAPLRYVYAVLVMFFAFLCFATIAVKLLFNRQAFKNFAKEIPLGEWLAYFVVLLVLLFLAAAETIGMLRNGNPLLYVILTCVKPVAALVVFFALARFCAPGAHDSGKNDTARDRGFRLSFEIVAVSFVVLVAYAVVFGGARIGVAVKDTRFLTRDMNRLRVAEKERDSYDKLMRAFSLCDEEAAKVYKLGYLAGERKWAEQGKAAGDELKSRRSIETEAMVGACIGSTQFFKATFYIDSLDKNYRFATGSVTQNLVSVMQGAQKNNYLLYLLSKLHALSGNLVLSRNYLQTFSFNYPDHPNAAFLAGQFKQDETKTYVMPCNYWLVPMEDAQVERTSEEIIMLNGRSVSGYLWLPEGKYVMTLYARDEGADHEKAKEVNFDPACKAEMWLDDETKSVRVISEDRRFQPYEMEFQVRKTPALFTLRFTNDRDEGKGLDRNLGLQKLEIRCVQ